MDHKSSENYDHHLQISIIGDKSVGKTCLTERFVGDHFEETHCVNYTDYDAIGVNIEHKSNRVLDKEVKLQIYDIPGDDKLKSGASSYYTGTPTHYANVDAFIVLFDITKRTTFNSLPSWLDKINSYTKQDKKLTIIVGTKLDLNGSRQVTEFEAQQFAKRLGFSYWEISSKYNVNILEMFNDIQTQLITGTPIDLMSIVASTASGKYLCITVQMIQQIMKASQRVNDSNIHEYESSAHQLRQRIIEQGVALNIYGLEDHGIFDEYVSDTALSEIVQIIFENIKSLEAVNYGRKSLFDILVRFIENYQHTLDYCHIKLPVIANESDNESMRDNRLYALGIGKSKQFECSIDDIILQGLISNSYPYQLWNKFSSNLKGNDELEILKLNIYNEEMNNELYVKKLADILKCLQLSNSKLTEFSLFFCFDVAMDYKSHDDPVLRNVLYSSIIKCIKSKAKYLIKLEVKYENDEEDNSFNLFDPQFCSQLMEIEYGNLTHFKLDIENSEMSTNNLISMNKLIETNDLLEKMKILSNINNSNFGQRKDETLSTNNMLPSSIGFEMELAIIAPQALEYCSSSLSKLISTTDGAIAICLSSDGLAGYHLYSLMDAWIDQLFKLYKYYKEIKDYLMDEENLTIFDEDIKEIIYEFIVWEQMGLGIYVVDDEKEELEEDEVEEIGCKLGIYCYEKIKELIYDNDITFGAIDKETEFETIMETIGCMANYIGLQAELEFCGGDILMNELEDYEEALLLTQMNRDYSILVCGFIRNIINTMSDIIIPYPLWCIIYDYYPNYDVYNITLEKEEDYERYLPLIKTKAPVSSYCDNPIFFQIGDNVFWKSLDHKWYSLNDDDVRSMKTDFYGITRNTEFMQFVNKKDIKIDDHTCIKWVLRLFDSNEIFTCINDGDIIKVNLKSSGIYGYNWSRDLNIDIKQEVDEDEVDATDALKANIFGINVDNQVRITDIVSTDQHALFLNSEGELYTFGNGEYGQCGVRNAVDLSDELILAPMLLQDISQKFITDIWVGENFSLCLDKYKNLYCWGSNEDNVMGLDVAKYRSPTLDATTNDADEDIIWEPMVHDLFNKDGKIIDNIKTGNKFVCFIDNEYQCYWSPSSQDQDAEENQALMKNITHFQSLYDQRYKHLKIKMAAFMLNTTSYHPYLALFDTQKRVGFYMGEAEHVEKRLIVMDIPNIGDDVIIACEWFNNLDGPIICVKSRMS